MTIYRMTATFGKLEHDTLLLEPGMNVIHGPNEWGKSTWCAFLAAMFYGLDTRAKSTRTGIADKERYAPWSGSPMSGRIDLRWENRNITIERSSKGRIPLGEFRAYETDTGLPIPDLTAVNCGQKLLGAEQSVFRRAGFIRLSDMPVTADESLRRRLNALVTTGDDSGDAEQLEKGLKDLRNRCRYNRSGLIPQAEGEKESIEKNLRELEALEDQSKKLRSRLSEVRSWARELEIHRQALLCAEAEADAARAAQARDTWEQTERELLELETICGRLPKQEEAEEKIRQIRAFQRSWELARMEMESIPPEPNPPEAPSPFADMPLPYAREMVERDIPRYELLNATKPYLVPLLMGGSFLFLGILAALSQQWIIAALTDVAGLVFLWLGCRKKRDWQGETYALEEKYDGADPEEWEQRLENYEHALQEYSKQQKSHRTFRMSLEQRQQRLEKQRQSLCAEQNPEAVLEIWQNILDTWSRFQILSRDAARAREHYEMVSAMVRSPKLPQMQDRLTCSPEETQTLLAEAEQEQQRLLSRLGQYRGRMEALGEQDTLNRQLCQVQQRIEKLEELYDAAQLGLDTLAQARRELQRRFAPRITRRAQELLQAMTGGRYCRLTLEEDFNLRTSAREEDILRDALWRSDGTVDQLYLALRLAVAEELMPRVPLVLDDALVRFDDTRLKAALEILEVYARDKQVILFTCQEREKNIFRK